MEIEDPSTSTVHMQPTSLQRPPTIPKVTPIHLQKINVNSISFLNDNNEVDYGEASLAHY